MLQATEQEKKKEKNLKGTDLNSLAGKEFKVMVIKILNGFNKRILELKVNLKKEKALKGNNQTLIVQ